MQFKFGLSVVRRLPSTILNIYADFYTKHNKKLFIMFSKLTTYYTNIILYYLTIIVFIVIKSTQISTELQ